MFEGKSLNILKELLSEPKKIVLLAHKNPDGDTIGSVLGMYHYLIAKGHSVTAMVPNQYPEYYNWMPGIKNILIYNNNSKEIKSGLKDAGLIFCLDFNDSSRISPMDGILKKANGIKIVVDHHPVPSDEFDHYFSITDTSSTGELVYELIKDIGDINYLNKEIAVSLYTCIMTDTGSFSYSCNRRRTYEITAELISTGINVNVIHRLVYDTFSEHRLRLLGFALTNNMIVWDDLHTAIIYLSKTDLKKFNYKVGDTEGLVNYPLQMKNINLSILITEKTDILRLSFRSKGEFAVNILAQKHFNGGGHINAAGGNSSLKMEKTLKKLKLVLNELKEQLNYQLIYK